MNSNIKLELTNTHPELYCKAVSNVIANSLPENFKKFLGKNTKVYYTEVNNMPGLHIDSVSSSKCNIIIICKDITAVDKLYTIYFCNTGIIHDLFQSSITEVSNVELNNLQSLIEEHTELHLCI